jgi:hypothetical protein
MRATVARIEIRPNIYRDGKVEEAWLTQAQARRDLERPAPPDSPAPRRRCP